MNSLARQDPTLGDALLDLLATVPDSDARRSGNPRAAARGYVRVAAAQAALTAGTLALPPGPLGWATVVPEMLGVWRIQARLVADVAASFGCSAELGREQMLHCLFRHSAAQALRDLAVRGGGRLLVGRSSVRLIQSLSARVGATVSRRGVASAVSRWVPVAGAAGVAAYAWHDTRQVGAAAIALFSGEDAGAMQLAAEA